MSIESENNRSVIPDLKEAHNNLQIALGDKAFQQYKAILRQYYIQKLTKIKFDEEARKLLCTSDQVHLHNVFLFALTDQVQPIKRTTYLDSDDESENAIQCLAAERFVPDEDLVKMRVLVAAYDNDLDGVEDDVAKYIACAAKLYLKNIITAVISKNSGYKIRENMFQHAIGFPVADPWIRNYNNIIDGTQESNIDINEEDNNVRPVIKESLESVQQQTAFAFACGSKDNIRSYTKINLLHLYETLLEDPTIINNHNIYSVNLERILGKLDILHM